MASNKFDKHIKEKLKSREINPTPNSWDVLANKLDAQENKPENKKFWWLGIAASIIGILFVATQFFNNNEEKHEQTIVNTENEKIKINNGLNNEPFEIINDNQENVIEIEKRVAQQIIKQNNIQYKKEIKIQPIPDFQNNVVKTEKSIQNKIEVSQKGRANQLTL